MRQFCPDLEPDQPHQTWSCYRAIQCNCNTGNCYFGSLELNFNAFWVKKLMSYPLPPVYFLCQPPGLVFHQKDTGYVLTRYPPVKWWPCTVIWFTKLVFWETPEWTAPNRSLSFSSEWFAEKGKMEIYHLSHTPNYPFSFKNIFFVSAFLWRNATTYNKFERGVKPNCSKAKCSTWRM